MAFHEVVPDGEAAKFEGFARELGEIQERQAKQSGQVERALHVKQHLGAVGELVVDLKGTTGAGVFAEDGARFPVYARFSNGASQRQNDKAPDARGFAMKLVGVQGPKLIPGLEQELTQDFLCISTSALPFRTPDEFMAFVRAAKDGPLLLVPRLLGGLGLGQGFGVLRRLLKRQEMDSFATTAFHTGAPIAFGATAAKLGFFPLQSGAAAKDGSDDAFRADLLRRLEAGPLSWAVRAQLFVDDQTTPIEDASVVWAGPWRELGRLTLNQRDPARGAELDALVAKMSFDPWHAIADHRPLGAVMRSRGAVYGASVKARGAAAEPKSVVF